MAQININVTPQFARELQKYMKVRGFSQKSEAIRAAVHEALERATVRPEATDFATWIGLANQAPQNPSPRFRDEDALWGRG